MKFFMSLILGAICVLSANAQASSYGRSTANVDQMQTIFDMGIRALESGQYNTAYANFMSACSAGIGTACLNVGIMFSSGVYVQQDENMAGHYYLKACNGTGPNGTPVLRDDIGCHNVALGYYDGIYGFEMNEDLSAQYFLQACDMRNAESCFAIATILRGNLLSGETPPAEQPQVMESMLTFFDKSCLLYHAEAYVQIVQDLARFSEFVESSTSRGTYIALACEAHTRRGSSLSPTWLSAYCPP